MLQLQSYLTAVILFGVIYGIDVPQTVVIILNDQILLSIKELLLDLVCYLAFIIKEHNCHLTIDCLEIIAEIQQVLIITAVDVTYC